MDIGIIFLFIFYITLILTFFLIEGLEFTILVLGGYSWSLFLYFIIYLFRYSKREFLTKNISNTIEHLKFYKNIIEENNFDQSEINEIDKFITRLNELNKYLKQNPDKQNDVMNSLVAISNELQSFYKKNTNELNDK